MTIAGASGFWGDRNDALLDQVRGGPVDVVMLDYLAEVTMSILRVKKARDPSAGYATDFVEALAPALDSIVEKKVRVVTNAGGMNPAALARAVTELARSRGISGLRVGVVTGDDICDALPDIEGRGVSLAHLDTGESFDAIRDRVLSANVYMGAEPIANALRDDAQIVVTGRCTDSALALGPLMAHFDWSTDDELATGVVVGHLLECGAQASGGNFAGGWEQVPDLANIGFPIAHVQRSGAFVVTKHPGTGGLITPAVLKEQLLYEIGDPRAYMTPDVAADFTTLALQDLGDDRVGVSGVTGHAAPAQLKASLSYDDGWKNAASMTFVWPRAVERAERTRDILMARFEKEGLHFDDVRFDVAPTTGLAWRAGAVESVAPIDGAPPGGAQPSEVILRVAVRTNDRESAARFSREFAPLILAGMPGLCRGLGGGGRTKPQRIVNFWPALVPREVVEPRVEVIES